MFSRVTQLEIDLLRVDIGEALELFEEEVVPRLSEQDGYEGAYVFVTPDGHAMLITFWETSESARATPFYSEQMARFVTLFRSPPGRESYEVIYADPPLVTA